jgi:L-lactate dehydrogenase
MEVGAFIDYLHACKPQPGVEGVQYPGEYEARNRALNEDTLTFDSRIWDGLTKLAVDLGVPEALPA